MTTQYKQMIAQAVQKHGLPPEYADIGYRQMMAESGGKLDAVSPKGAQGLMQFMPKTAQAYGLTNPNDPAQSIDAWARMTKDLIQQTGGNPAHVLAAYNWGIGNLSKQGMDKMPVETRNYIQKIMGDVPVGTQVAAAPAQVYRPSQPVLDSIGPADYHRAVERHHEPGIPAQHEGTATPEFDIRNYSPKAQLAAFGPDAVSVLGAYGPVSQEGVS